MNLQRLFICVGLFFLFFPGGYSQIKNGNGITEIIILHTNDMHAKIDNLGKLAYLADSLRKAHPYVFLVSAGDNFTGNPLVDMVEDKGFPMIDLMNRCGFNVSAIGNHEFDLGQEMLNRRIKQADFPFICCNLDASEAVLKQPPPYLVLKAGEKIHIAFLGIIELGPDGLPDTHPSRLTGIRFYNGIEKARDFLRLKEKYDILIGLTHLGVEDDTRLAGNYPQFDLIIGGHSHTLIEKPLIINGVLIVQAGSNLRFIGKTTLYVRNGHVTERLYEIIPVNSLTRTDSTIQSLVEEYNSNRELQQVIAEAEAPMTGPEELGSLMTDAITQQLKVDFAFQNNKGIRLYSIPKGNITLSDIYKMDPFGNQVVIFRMNAGEIRSLICNAYDREHGTDLKASGMTYTVISDTADRCMNVEMLDRSGIPLDNSREYTVGMNSYIASTYRFDHRDPGNTAAITTAQTLIDYLKEVKKVNYSGIRRTCVKKQFDR